MFEQKSTPYPNPERDRLLWEIRRLILEYDGRGNDYRAKREQQEELKIRCCYGMSRVCVILDRPGLTDEQRIAEIRSLGEKLDVAFLPHSYSPIAKNPKTTEDP